MEVEEGEMAVGGGEAVAVDMADMATEGEAVVADVVATEAEGTLTQADEMLTETVGDEEADTLLDGEEDGELVVPAASTEPAADTVAAEPATTIAAATTVGATTAAVSGKTAPSQLAVLAVPKPLASNMPRVQKEKQKQAAQEDVAG